VSNSFQTTRWTLVLRASSPDEETRREALAELLALNWYPLYSFLRYSGKQASEAEDLIQGFFVRVLERDLFAGLEQHRRGRFRSFLLVCLKRYALNQSRSERAIKRGGGKRVVSIDFEAADQRFQHEPSHDLTPEKAFDRDWAMELIQRSLRALGQRWSDAGKSEEFKKLKGFLTRDEGLSREAIAAELSISKNTLKVRIHRLTAEFRQILCQQIADTLGREDLLEDEINYLFRSFNR